MSKLKDCLITIVRKDIDTIIVKNKEYGESWKKRGGVGAFMMLARKWDRIEEQVKSKNYNIFNACVEDKRTEGILDDIRDLRCYLALVESELVDNKTKISSEDDEHDDYEDGFKLWRKEA